MLKSTNSLEAPQKTSRYKKLKAMSKEYKGLLSELYNPVDAANRFINLALESVEERSQSRQFLLESKEGLRKTASLLRKLDECSQRMEKEIRGISEKDVNE